MKSNNSVNYFTLKILNIAGTPFAKTEKVSINEVDKSLLRYAILNRMHLLFLESLREHHTNLFVGELVKLSARFERVNEAIINVAEILEKNNIEYAFFKSIRPYREVTIDIDVIIFHNRKKTTQILKDAGLRLLEIGPLSTTMRDEHADINIDLYGEIGVSHIIYMDKQKILPYVIKMLICDGYSVKTLDPVADLLAIISHSIIKEQMYVLSEYFTTIHYLYQMNNREICRLVATAEEWKLKKALSTHLSITSLIHLKAHGFIPKQLKKLHEKISYNSREIERIRKRNYQIPYKYHPLTVIDSFIEKFSESTASKSFAIQLLKMTDPAFATIFMKKAFQHLFREKY